MIALLVVGALVVLIAAVGALWAAGTPCTGCDQPAMDCRCPVHPGERAELALLAGGADPDFVATQAAGYGETADEWAARTGMQPTQHQRPAVNNLPLPANANPEGTS